MQKIFLLSFTPLPSSILLFPSRCPPGKAKHGIKSPELFPGNTLSFRYCRPYLGWGRSEFLRAVSRRGRWLCRGRTERVAVWHRSQETAAALPAWRSAAQGHLCNVQVIHCQLQRVYGLSQPQSAFGSHDLREWGGGGSLDKHQVKIPKGGRILPV